MAPVLVVFHSGYGHTQRLAQAVADGARAELIAIDAEGSLPAGSWERLHDARAIVFGAPTYMGGPSWQFKKFADASSKPWFVQAWKDKLFAGFTNSAAMNGDKHATLRYFMTLAMQHGGLWIGSGMLPSNMKAAQRNDINWMGSYAGVMSQSPADASPNEMAPGDLETARQFGQRIADAAARWSPSP
jgi:NAD(P)H dehydrogenase (quinone)